MSEPTIEDLQKEIAVLKDRLAEATDEGGDQVRSTIARIGRGGAERVARLGHGTADLVRERPVTSLATTALGAAAIGAVTALLVQRRRAA